MSEPGRIDATSLMKIRRKELVENPTSRVPVCLCLDTSSSMDGEAIRELNRGVQIFYKSILEHDIAKYSAEICIVTFGDVAVKIIDFDAIHRQVIPELVAYGMTPMGAGVNLALSLLEERKQEYTRAGIDYYQPWLVLMTDGAPTDDITSASDKVSQLITKKKLTIFPIGVGPNADLETLKSFSPNRTPLRLKGLNFGKFFEWLSKSVAAVSVSIPGQHTPLDEEGIKGWGEL